MEASATPQEGRIDDPKSWRLQKDEEAGSYARHQVRASPEADEKRAKSGEAEDQEVTKGICAGTT